MFNTNLNTMKTLIYFLAVAGLLFLVTFIGNYFAIKIDPDMNMERVKYPVIYGCLFFSIIMSGTNLIFNPPKRKAR